MLRIIGFITVVYLSFCWVTQSFPHWAMIDSHFAGGITTGFMGVMGIILGAVLAFGMLVAMAIGAVVMSVGLPILFLVLLACIFLTPLLPLLALFGLGLFIASIFGRAAPQSLD